MVAGTVVVDSDWDQSGAAMEKTVAGPGDSGGSSQAGCAIQELCRPRPSLEVPVYRVRRWEVALFGRQVEQRAGGSCRLDVGVDGGNNNNGDEGA